MRAPPGRLRSVAILGGGTLLAAVFGLLFQALLSYHFGAGAETDAWFMSLSIYAFLAKFLMLTNVKSLRGRHDLFGHQKIPSTDLLYSNAYTVYNSSFIIVFNSKAA